MIVIDRDTLLELALMGKTKDGRFALGEGAAEALLAEARKLTGIQDAMAARQDESTVSPHLRHCDAVVKPFDVAAQNACTCAPYEGEDGA